MTIPLNILEIDIAHHIPLSPKNVADKTITIGIRAAVSTVETHEGINVFPNPLSAPASVLSIHIKSCEKARICK